MFDKKLEAIKNRSGSNIKSGRVMMEVKDRDWLFATIENLTLRTTQLEKELLALNNGVSLEEYNFYAKLVELFDENFKGWRK